MIFAQQDGLCKRIEGMNALHSIRGVTLSKITQESNMITSRIAVVALAALFAANTYAANAQQNKMATCNKEAGEKALKGDARKAFMSDCLKAKPEASAPAAAPTQQTKMKTCNKDAGEKNLKGDERKKFMSECLKK